MKGIATFIISALIMLVGIAGCAATYPFPHPALEDEGEVYVYVQPLLQEAERLRFKLEGVAAVLRDGSEIPLALSLAEFTAPDVRRQRLVASGPLPAGAYRGLSFKVVQASLMTEDGEASLLVPEKSVTADFPFMITRKKATVLFMRFNYQESVTQGFSFRPAFSLWLPGNPVTGLLGYVSNSRTNSITVFDKKAGQVVSALATGKEPRGIVFDPARSRAYVALSGEDAVSVIDMISGDLLNIIRLNAGDSPQDLSLTPDGGVLLAVNAGSNSVSFIDPLSFVELGRTVVGNAPRSILLDRRGGRKGYVFNVLSNSISVIDIPTMSTAATVPTEVGPLQGQFNRKGDKLYVIYQGSPYLTVMDPASFQVSNRVFIGPSAGALKVDAMTDMIYIARKQASEVEIFDPFSLIAVDFIRTTGGASYMTIDGEENSLLLLSPERKTLTIVNINSRKVVSVLDVGEDPYRVSLMGER